MSAQCSHNGAGGGSEAAGKELRGASQRIGCWCNGLGTERVVAVCTHRGADQ